MTIMEDLAFVSSESWERGCKVLEEIVAENFLNLARNIQLKN